MADQHTPAVRVGNGVSFKVSILLLATPLKSENPEVGEHLAQSPFVKEHFALCVSRLVVHAL
eukprot:1197814-Amphidinium_carterae.1